MEKTETKLGQQEESKDSSKSQSKEVLANAVEKVKEKLASPKKEKEVKVELEREYVIPLRRQVMKAQNYRKAKKAIRTIKEFLAKHMRVENRDLRLIKIDRYLNQEIWYKGIKHPPAKIKVKAIKKEGIVYVELAEIPEKVKWDMEKDKKKLIEGSKVKTQDKPKEEKKQETTEQKVEEKEKEKASVEAGFKEQKLEAKQDKHQEKPKQPKQAQIQRKVMKR
jgi:large subunit ribosomal protein L31e